MIGPAYTYQATVRRWVDGDTVDLDVDLGFNMHARVRFRLHGVDTPERGQPGYAEATDLCREVAPEGTTVRVDSYKDGDKYGRWLGLVTTPAGRSVQYALLEAGLAVPYFGGARG